MRRKNSLSNKSDSYIEGMGLQVEEDGDNRSKNEDMDNSFIKVVEFDDDQIERKSNINLRMESVYSVDENNDEDCRIFPTNVSQFGDQAKSQSVVEVEQTPVKTKKALSPKSRISASSFIMRNNLYSKRRATVQPDTFISLKHNPRITELEAQVFTMESEKTALEQSLKIMEDELVKQKEKEEELLFKITSDESQFKQLTECLASLKTKNKQLKFENEELLNLNEHLQDTVTRNQKYLEGKIGKLAEESDRWKQLAMERDVEIQSLKMNQ